jgi:hypothetical protein
MAKLQHGFFTVNGMNWWNKHIREAMQLGAMRRMGVAANYSKQQLRDLGDDAKQLNIMLDEYGIDDAEWEMIRSVSKHIDKDNARVSDSAGRNQDVYLGIDMVDDISSDRMFEYLSGKGRKNISEAAIGKERDALKNKYSAMMLAEMDRGVLTPGVQEWRQMNMGTKEGSWQNMFLKMIFQYKSYPVAMMNKVLVPAWKNSNMLPVLGYAAYAAGLSVMVQQTKSVLEGKTARPWGDPMLWMDGVTRSGGLSFAWDILSKDWSESGYEGGVSSLLGGPGFDLASDAMGVAYQAGKAPFTEEGWDALGKKTTKFLQSWTPASNIPIVQQVFRGLVTYPLMDMFGPESLERSEKWIDRELDQQYWWGSPTDNNIAPDIQDIL